MTALWWTLALLISSASARADGLLIIANPSVAADEPLKIADLEAIYLLRLTLWPDGTAIVPVNREAMSAARGHFTGIVLHQDEASLIGYWNEMHYKGKQPPVVQESDAAVLAFVQHVPGAVGYISDTTQPMGVKLLARLP